MGLNWLCYNRKTVTLHLKKIAIILVAVPITLALTGHRSALPKTTEQRVSVVSQKVAKAVQKAHAVVATPKVVNAPTPAPTPATTAQNVPEAQPSTTVTCASAVASVWPASLQSGAMTVIDHENHAQNPYAIGAVNSDGSHDYGCFQINNFAHAAWFAAVGAGWSSPTVNATEALAIYNGRHNWSAWYAVEGILW